MTTIPATFTVRQLSEILGTEYLETGGLVRCAVTLHSIVSAGEAPRAEKSKGKPANLFRFTESEAGRTFRDALITAKNQKG